MQKQIRISLFLVLLIVDLSENATAKEFKTVIKHVANQANEQQRKLVGLDKNSKTN